MEQLSHPLSSRSRHLNTLAHLQNKVSLLISILCTKRIHILYYFFFLGKYWSTWLTSCILNPEVSSLCRLNPDPSSDYSPSFVFSRTYNYPLLFFRRSCKTSSKASRTESNSSNPPPSLRRVSHVCLRREARRPPHFLPCVYIIWGIRRRFEREIASS